jgi:hypothetical protein
MREISPFSKYVRSKGVFACGTHALTHRRYLVIFSETERLSQGFICETFKSGCPIHVPCYLSESRAVILLEVDTLGGNTGKRSVSVSMLTDVFLTKCPNLVCADIIEIIVTKKLLVGGQRDFVLWGRTRSYEVFVSFRRKCKRRKRPECAALVVRISGSQFDVVRSFRVGNI